jgi:hypothetical protein
MNVEREYYPRKAAKSSGAKTTEEWALSRKGCARLRAYLPEPKSRRVKTEQGVRSRTKRRCCTTASTHSAHLPPSNDALRKVYSITSSAVIASRSAGGVGDERPYRRRRLGEMPFLAVAVDCLHSIASKLVEICRGSHLLSGGDVFKRRGQAFAC